MEPVRMTNDDNRLGLLNEDGSIYRWPDYDVFGKPYEVRNATLRHVDDEAFVVIPPNGDSDELTVVVEG